MIKALSDDIEPVVRAASMEKVPSLARFLISVIFFFSFRSFLSSPLIPFFSFFMKAGGEEGLLVVTSEIIPIVRKLLVDKNVQVQEAFPESLLAIL